MCLMYDIRIRVLRDFIDPKMTRASNQESLHIFTGIKHCFA